MRPLAITGLIFLFFGFLLSVFSGLFAPISVEQAKRGERWIIYETHTGPYENAGTVLEYVKGSLFMEKAVSYTQTFGLYFDNENDTKEKELRSVQGVIIDNPTDALIIYLNTRYKVARLPPCQSVTVNFPLKTFLSVLLADLRITPVLNAYLKENLLESLPLLKVYNQDTQTITYSSPLNLSHDILDDVFKHEFVVNKFLNE